ncbi:MAG TPA: hypothetical protein K8V00_01660 [Ligilactobacillus acidipiscis]|uniref:Uncharacterized protein n=1 Tax=Ligilactobacillus acidipiscis TaxID=89059 RepID=A0A921F7Z6_9LACO|nr:hypothetical protein [Ligilactobacillus acidipiscis]
MKDKEDAVIFTTTSGFSKNKITLYENTLVNHVVGDHSGREFLIDEYNIAIVKNIVETPDIVTEDAEHIDRLNYYSIVVFSGTNTTTDVKIVTEEVVGGKKQNVGEIVTIVPVNHGKTKIGESNGRRVLYDQHSIK